MKYLTRQEVAKSAPGAARRKNAARERLLDTQEWLDELEKSGFRPAFAMQGSTHDDAGHAPRDGRHIVVAEKGGVAYALLNSHDRLMRVWGGVGVFGRDELMLHSVAPLQRWRWRQNWESFATSKLEAEIEEAVRTNSVVLKPDLTPLFIERTAREIAREGYIQDRGRPSARALSDIAQKQNKDWTPLLVGLTIVGLCRAGNIPPSTHQTTRRNVKGIRRPDAYWHLAQAAWKASLDGEG